jgi:hypothetical protein
MKLARNKPSGRVRRLETEQAGEQVKDPTSLADLEPLVG